MEIKTLYTNQWLELKQIDGDNYSYVYSHEKRSNGQIVAILPWRYSESGTIEYMLRNELTPCWSTKDLIVSSITGGVENDSPINTALHEIKEEAGYTILEEDLVPLGTVRTSKSSDTLYFLYTFNATNLKQKSQDGDGSELEKAATSFWTKSINESQDALVYTLFYRLYSVADL